MTRIEVLVPPSEADVAAVLARFSSEVRRHYGSRLVGLYLFGSRARGDHDPDSDVDLAVILTDANWRLWDEKRFLADLALDHLVERGIHVQSWPFSQSRWLTRDDDDDLVWAARRDAIPIEPRWEVTVGQGRPFPSPLCGRGWFGRRPNRVRGHG